MITCPHRKDKYVIFPPEKFIIFGRRRQFSAFRDTGQAGLKPFSAKARQLHRRAAGHEEPNGAAHLADLAPATRTDRNRGFSGLNEKLSLTIWIRDLRCSKEATRASLDPVKDLHW